VDRHPLNRGLDAVFRGLGSLIQIATDTARVQDDAATVFGVSLRVGRSAVKVAPAARVSRPAARRPPEPEEGRAPAADVFDEDDHFVVVIRALSGDRSFARTIELDAAVNADTTTMRYENGVLELRLWKRC
jgi:hypothetical protein